MNEPAAPIGPTVRDRNPKPEIRNPKQIQRLHTQRRKTRARRRLGHNFGAHAFVREHFQQHGMVHPAIDK